MTRLKKNELNIYLIICLLLCIYVVLRSIYVPIVHDEAVTFFNYINTGKFIPFINWGHHADANNHVLNSAISHVFFKFFGSDLWVIRLASTLSLLILLIYVWKISSFLENLYVKWGFIVSFLGSHYLIEFFSLSRGYGMSISFLIGAIYHLLWYVKNQKSIHLFGYSLMILLGLMANLTLVNTAFIGFTLVLYILLAKRPHGVCLQQGLITFFLVFIPLLGAILTSLKYQQLELLYYGQGDSYWEVTVDSFFQRFTLIENPYYLVYPIILPVLLGCLYNVISSFVNSKWNSISDKANILAIFFFGNIIMSIIQTSFMNVNYPEDRTALFFFPFLIGMVAFYADSIPKVRWMLIPFLYLPLQFVFAINIDYNSFWKNERMTDEYFQIVLNDYLKNVEQPVVGGYTMRQVIWDYYNYKNGGKLGRLHCEDYLNDTISDYIIIDNEHVNPYWSTLYKKQATDPYSNLSLIERKKRLIPTKVQDSYEEVRTEKDSREFILFGEYKGKDIEEKYIQTRWDLFYQPELFVSDVWLILQGVDGEGNQTFFQYASLERLRADFKKDIEIKQKLVSPLIPKRTASVKAYIRNLNKEPISIYRGKLSFYIY